MIVQFIRFFPTLTIVLDICAAVVYALNKDTRHTIYWLSAAILTASVTY